MESDRRWNTRRGFKTNRRRFDNGPNFCRTSSPVTFRLLREGKGPESRTTRSTNGSHSKSDTKTEVLVPSVLVHDEMAYQP
jgi:hypothetical protein